LLPEQIPFYRDLVSLCLNVTNFLTILSCIDLVENTKQAAVAVEGGVCIDIFSVTDEYTDLASLKFLSIESGGSLFLYANTGDSTLPQDMYA
jgi:hypothetical protein